MNWINKYVRSQSILPGFLLGLIVAFIILFTFGKVFHQPTSKNLTSQKENQSTESAKINLIPVIRPDFEKNSPDTLMKVSVYKKSFDSTFFTSYSNFAEDEVVMFVGFQNEYLKRRMVFTGDDRTGDPDWLGNDQIFFTAYCGTGCQGIYLVDVFSKKTLQAGLAYLFDKNGQGYTVFDDWFGKEFRFPGFADEIRSEMKDEKAYLIFTIHDENNKVLEQKRFLFLGNSLKLIR